MVFVPSKATFPIKTLNDSFETGRPKECQICHDVVLFGKQREKSAPNFIGGEYRFVCYRLNLEKTLEYVCKGCFFWIPFDYSAFEKSFGTNYLEKTRKDWDAIKDKISADFPMHVCAHLYKYLRKARYEQVIEYDWRSHFSTREINWLEAKFNTLIQDYDYCDNFRVADVSKRGQVRRYWKEKKQGCCGSVDIERASWFKTYLIGFNYGH